jgi:hypothetical protein
MWPANDTISYDLSVAKWIEYFSEAALNWLTWQGPMRATQFNPADFSIQYPVGISRVRADFYLHASYPWPDSSFLFDIYADDGATLLYESETLEARPGTPGAFTAYTLDSMLIIPDGTFWVAIQPVSMTGHPSTCGDDTVDGHSFAGVPGSWSPWTMGEFFISASVQGNVGVEDGYDPNIKTPAISVTNYPNPVTDRAEVKWQVPYAMPVNVNLHDATGRMIASLYSSDKARVGTVVLETKSMAAGVYLVRLETPKGTATRKLVIDR